MIYSLCVNTQSILDQNAPVNHQHTVESKLETFPSILKFETN